MPRPANPLVRIRLLEAGIELFHHKGFHGCGLQEIAALAEVPKGSFYAYFADKDEFASEVLGEYWARIKDSCVKVLSDPNLSGPKRIAEHFQALKAQHEAHGFELGCLMAMLAAELSATNEKVRDKLDEIIHEWRGELTEAIRAGQAGGEIDIDLDSTEVAAGLIEAWEGSALFGKIARSARPYDRFNDMILAPLIRPKVAASI